MEMCCSLIFKYWSTDIRVPVMHTSFLSSTATSFPIKVLKKEKKSIRKEEKENEDEVRFVRLRANAKISQL